MGKNVWVKVSGEKYGGWRKERLLQLRELASGCFQEAAVWGKGGRTLKAGDGGGGGVGAAGTVQGSEASSGQQGLVPQSLR